MQFKIAERYYPVKLKKKVLNRFEVNNKDTRTTPLGFRIFGSIRHHSILSAFRER